MCYVALLEVRSITWGSWRKSQGVGGAVLPGEALGKNVSFPLPTEAACFPWLMALSSVIEVSAHSPLTSASIVTCPLALLPLGPL